MIYKYKAVNSNGEIVEDSFETSSKEEVIGMLKSKDFMPISIEVDIEKAAQSNIFDKKVSKKDLAIFCRQFYTMVDAGIPIIKCIDILTEQSDNKTLKKSLTDMGLEVQKGTNLSGSMKNTKKPFHSS